MKRLLRASVNSWNGISATARGEAAFRQELFVFLIAIPIAFLIATEPWRRAVLIVSIVFIMIVELLNTAIEKIGDHISPGYDPRIGFIKDVGSAAVGLSLVLAAALWLAALVERLGWP